MFKWKKTVSYLPGGNDLFKRRSFRIQKREETIAMSASLRKIIVQFNQAET